jgi:hypothetical protein
VCGQLTVCCAVWAVPASLPPQFDVSCEALMRMSDGAAAATPVHARRELCAMWYRCTHAACALCWRRGDCVARLPVADFVAFYCKYVVAIRPRGVSLYAWPVAAGVLMALAMLLSVAATCGPVAVAWGRVASPIHSDTVIFVVTVCSVLSCCSLLPRARGCVSMIAGAVACGCCAVVPGVTRAARWSCR